MSVKPLDLSGVPNRRDLLAEAKRLGCTVTTGNGGEARVVSPDGERVNLNNRRKDGARALLVLLRRLQAEEKR